MPKPYLPQDKLAVKARRQGFRARSVYKLMELDAKYGLLRPGMKVLDIGAAPGSWLQYASAQIGPQGKVLGVDLTPIAPIAPNVTTQVLDITQPLTFEGKFDLILSDIAPNTTGVAHHDQKQSVDLDRKIFDLAKTYLVPSGILVMKVFQGAELPVFLRELHAYFRNVAVTKSHASRDRSKEVYVLCQ